MQILRGGSARPGRIVFSPDGRYLAAGAQGSFHLWEPAAGPDPLWSIRSVSLSSNFVFTADGASLLGGIGKVGLSDARTGAWRAVPFSPFISPTAFSPDGRCAVGDVRTGTSVLPLWLARLTPNGWVDVWRKEQTYDFDTGLHRPLVFSVDGARVLQKRVCGPPTGKTVPYGVTAFDTQTGEVLAEWAGRLPGSMRLGPASPSGGLVVFLEHTFYVIDTTAPDAQPIPRPNVSREHITSVALSRDGCRLATTSGATAAVWDATTWEVRHCYEWQIGRLLAVCFAPDGLRCAAAGDTGQIVVWDLDD
jgi:WD40 repeat protein